MAEGLLCLNCSEVINPEQAQRLSCCPNCGDRGTPADLATTVTLNITTHELRVLVMWAERWAGMERQTTTDREEMQRAVYGIADRLETQMPDGAPRLTLMGEITQVREQHGHVEVQGFVEPTMAVGDPETPQPEETQP